MKQVLISLLFLMARFITLYAQESGTYSKTERLTEPDLHSLQDTSSWIPVKQGLHTSFVSTNVHYETSTCPVSDLNKAFAQSGWRNEQLNCAVLVWSKQAVGSLTVSCTLFKNKKGMKMRNDAKIQIVKNVIAEYSAGKCGNTATSIYKSNLTPDLIEDASTFKLGASTSRVIWISLKIPVSTSPGAYSAKINFLIGGKPAADALDWTVHVMPRTLTENKKTRFNLNLWQNPYQVASFSKVIPWSAEHYRLLKPAMKMLADAGQTCITASFFWDSFNTESKGLSNAMIITRKQKDGSWNYDYTHFDTWVNFMMELGIKDEIAIFGLDSWYPNLWYWDELLQREVNLKAIPGSFEYTAFWTPLLKNFRDHLITKHWIDLVTIAIDERAFNSIESDIHFVRAIDPRFKFQVSGLYHSSLEPEIYDYALNSNQKVPQGTLERRARLHKKTSYYTACWEINPNSLLSNEPGDSWFLPLYSYANKMNGFSRYAFNNWSAINLTDARNPEVPPGDAFFIYPGSRSSVRFEKLQEGICTIRKFSQLLNEAEIAGDKQMKKKLEILLLRLKTFKSPSDAFIREEETTLNQF